MKLEFDETETTGHPFIMAGAVDSIMAIIRRHDGRLWFGIVCALVKELMKASDENGRIVATRISEAVLEGEDERED